MAQIDIGLTAETITYLHSDHLGTPRRGTDENGVVVWLWQSDAFGATAANDDPDGDGVSTVVDLRFAGQYYDSETQLHYNYFRYYDPGTGRYVTSDPIGLEGGLNSYAYALNSPVRHTDPNGLSPGAICLAPGLCPAIVQVCKYAVTRIAQYILAGIVYAIVDCEDDSCSGESGDEDDYWEDQFPEEQDRKKNRRRRNKERADKPQDPVERDRRQREYEDRKRRTGRGGDKPSPTGDDW